MFAHRPVYCVTEWQTRELALGILYGRCKMLSMTNWLWMWKILILDLSFVESISVDVSLIWQHIDSVASLFQTLYKIIDLGYAKELDINSICDSFVGTVQYLVSCRISSFIHLISPSSPCLDSHQVLVSKLVVCFDTLQEYIECLYALIDHNLKF